MRSISQKNVAQEQLRRWKCVCIDINTNIYCVAYIHHLEVIGNIAESQAKQCNLKGKRTIGATK